MDKIKTTQGDLIARDARFAIVASRFNDFIVDSLLKAAVHCLRQHGAADADIEIRFRLIEGPSDRALTKSDLETLFPESLSTHSPGCQRRSTLRRAG